MGITEDYVAGEMGKHLLEYHQAQPPPPPPPPPTPASIGVLGHGALTPGGYLGDVNFVIHPGSTGEGSLRNAVRGSNPKVAIFRTGSMSDLKGQDIVVNDPFLTIAGQSAPGDGFALKNGTLQMRSHNFQVLYLHWRGGSGSFIKMRQDAHDFVISHNSISGSKANSIGAAWQKGKPDIRRATISHNLIAEPLKGHPTATLFTGSSDLTINPPLIGNEHNYEISIYGNFYCHCGHRSPRLRTRNSEVVNNYVYNWRARIGGTSGAAESDWINNFWQPGPMTSKTRRYLGFKWLHKKCQPFPLSSIYIAGNLLPGTLDDVNRDNWFLWQTNERTCGDGGNPVPETNRRMMPLPPAPVPLLILPTSAVPSFRDLAGSSRAIEGNGEWRLRRDSADTTYYNDSVNGTGPTKIPTSIVIPDYENGQPYECGPDGIGWLYKDIWGLERDRDYSKVLAPNGLPWLRCFLEGITPR